MSRRPYYARKHRRWPLWLAITAAACGAWSLFFSFDSQKIIEQSELKAHTFTAKVEEITAPKSGLKAYLMTEKSNPIVSVNFIFADSGSAYDRPGKKGLSGLTAQMMSEGAGHLDRRRYKDELENYATDIEYEAGQDDFGGSLLTLKENLEPAKKLLALTLYEPRFDKEDLERLQRQTVQAVDRMMEKPNGRLAEFAGKAVFQNHPYAGGALEVRKDVKNVSDADMRKFIRERLTKDVLHIGIAGDISKAEAEAFVDDVFGGLEAERPQSGLSAPETDFSFREEMLEEDDLPQVLTAVFAPAVPRLNKDFYPLYIANYVLGGAGLNSRLNQAAREKEGLTYGVYTGMRLLQQAPQLTGGFSTTPENFERMKEIFVEQWSKMGAEGISARELQAAKNYLQNSYNLRFADIGTLAAILAHMQREGLGTDFLQKRNRYIEEVTLEQANTAARKYFSPKRLLIISLGKNKQERN